MLSELHRLDKRLIVVAIIGSLLLSLWGVIVDDVVNNDGIEYIKSAKNLLLGNWEAAIESFKWPFYSGLMAIMHQLFGIDLVLAGQLINAFFFAWLVLAFVACVRALGGEGATLWFALFVVLLFPPLNKFRPHLIRDPGFLALYFSALYHYFNYLRHGVRADIHKTWGLLLLSTLFRIEGLVFLVAIQAYSVFTRLAHQTSLAVRIILVLLLGFAALLLASWWNFTPDGELTYLSVFSQPAEFFTTVWGQVFEQASSKVHAIRTKLLVGYSSSYTHTLFVLSAITILVFEVIDKLYIIYFLIFLVAWRFNLLFPHRSLYRPWRFLIIISLLVLLVFIFINWFLSDRYPLTVALMVLLATPFALNYGFQRMRLGRKGARRWFIITTVLIVLAGIKGFDLFTNDRYLKQSAAWLDDYAAETAKVYTNNRMFAHYYNDDDRGEKAVTARARKYWVNYKRAIIVAKVEGANYMALQLGREYAAFAERIPVVLNREVIKTFTNEKGAQILIVEITPDRALTAEMAEEKP